MENYHTGFDKYFVKLPLRCEPLEQLRVPVLRGHKPARAMHLTLTTLYIAAGRGDMMNKVEAIIDTHASHLIKAMHLPAEIRTAGPRYKAMGHTHVKSFALCFAGPSEDAFGCLRTTLCALLENKLGLLCRCVSIGERLYVELCHSDEDGNLEALVRLPDNCCVDDARWHVSLFSTIDLQRHNKVLYNEWRKSDPEKFLAHLLGEPHELVISYDDAILEMKPAKDANVAYFRSIIAQRRPVDATVENALACMGATTYDKLFLERDIYLILDVLNQYGYAQIDKEFFDPRTGGT